MGFAFFWYKQLKNEEIFPDLGAVYLFFGVGLHGRICCQASRRRPVCKACLPRTRLYLGKR